MGTVDNVYQDYVEIHGLKSKHGEFTENDHLFATMALIYALSPYSDKYNVLNDHYDDIIERYYGYGEIDSRIEELIEDMETIREQQDYTTNLFSKYDEIKDSMIGHIMNFVPELDREEATKVFNLYYTIFLGGLLNVGDEKLSDRAISNLMLYRSTKYKYDYPFSKNEYAKYAMPKYFARANDRFNKVRKGEYYDRLYQTVDDHRKSTKKANYFKGFEEFNLPGLDQLYRAHDCMELNLNKRFLGKKFKQTDLFANSNYRLYKNIYPEMKSIIYGEYNREEQINEYLMDFVDRMMPYHNIDGCYTIKYTDHDYKLVMVTKDIEEYNRLLEGLASLVSSINRYNNRVSDISFTIMPVFAPYLRCRDYSCDVFKESLLNSDTILYDKKRFLRKTKGMIREEFKERNIARQYVKRD